MPAGGQRCCLLLRFTAMKSCRRCNRGKTHYHMSAMSYYSLATCPQYLDFLYSYSRKQVKYLPAHDSHPQFCSPKQLCHLSAGFRSRSPAAKSTFLSEFACERSSFAAFAPNAPKCASAGPAGAHIPDENSFTQDGFESFLLSMQEQICREAAEADGGGLQFLTDKWQRGDDPAAGYGITRVLEGGQLLEKAAANVSIIRGHLSVERAQAMSARVDSRDLPAGTPYFAGALSLVFHSANPFVPTFRSDIRYFEVQGHRGWFGGGADLTPAYLFEDDCTSFHKFYKAICDKYDPSLYPKCKKMCDEYFYIPSRNEHRGVGGVFFDDMVSLEGGETTLSEPEMSTLQHEKNTKNESMEGEGDASGAAEMRAYEFVRRIAEGWMGSYLLLAQKRRGLSFGEKEREWQLIRRGRYLEFNLLYDRGVRFGMEGGRVESIMVSAPPLIAWKYNVVPSLGSREEALLKVLKTPRKWA